MLVYKDTGTSCSLLNEPCVTDKYHVQIYIPVKRNGSMKRCQKVSRVQFLVSELSTRVQLLLLVGWVVSLMGGWLNGWVLVLVVG